ncbi:hypothetical protein GQX73_g1253 [Xylaria multiplex]|uniref:Bacteriophage T5 Orf172 DNA-binding domain-containing protein n=1 Tax=Xylaria multiplex TaxID=323545 RepID=A0A7C8MVC6_9PEZI|nr:hypothetical protein GQX73_g1253 [Xylaria multiplex]
MRGDLKELLQAPISPISTSPTTNPPRTRKQLRKVYQKRLGLPEWARSTPSQAHRPGRTNNHPMPLEQDNDFKQTHDSRSKISTPSRDRGDYDPFQRDHGSRLPPSTPKRPGPRPGPFTPWSAPGRLEPTRTSYLNSLSDGIDNKIIKQLKEGLPKGQLDKEKLGTVYLFKVVFARDPGRTILKIGHTAGTERDRMRGIGAKCRHLSMEGEAVPEARSILLFQRAERLAQVHLDDHLYNPMCMCRTAHREYFDVDTASSRAVIGLWSTFCKSNPYDAEGNLRPFWKHRLRQVKKLPYWGDQAPEGLSKLESRQKRWEAFANPKRIEEYWFWATVAPWPWSLHIIILFQAVKIALSDAVRLSLAFLLIAAFCTWRG